MHINRLSCLATQTLSMVVHQGHPILVGAVDREVKRNRTRPGDETAEAQALSTAGQDKSIKILSAALFIVSGIVFLAYAMGKFVTVSKKQMQALAASGLAGITMFLILDIQEITEVTSVVLTVAVICAALLAGFAVFVKGMVKLGDFALGGLAGYVIGVFVAQFLASNILETQLARYLFVAAFCAGGGYWVMANPTDRYLTIAALIAGAFSLIYGLDYFVFKSNFSNIGRVALDGDAFGGFDTDTIVTFTVFFALIGAGIYLQKAKIM